MKERKYVFRFFTPDMYEKEEQFLRNMSLNGWHFSNLFFGLYEFEKGQPTAYSYRLDFVNNDNVDMSSYLSLYEDCGWNHLFELKIFLKGR